MTSAIESKLLHRLTDIQTDGPARLEASVPDFVQPLSRPPFLCWATAMIKYSTQSSSSPCNVKDAMAMDCGISMVTAHDREVRSRLRRRMELSGGNRCMHGRSLRVTKERDLLMFGFNERMGGWVFLGGLLSALV